jgi:methionyl-tRNA formyltransferase
LQDHAAATYAPLLKKEDGRVRWQESAIHIHNMIRGLSPWPTAYTYFQGKVVKLLHTRVEAFSADAAEMPPGTVVALDASTGPLISTGNGTLRILKIQPANKRPMRCSDFCRGYRLQVGDRLGE